MLDVRDAGVDQPAEHAGEDEHVVDLVREVRATRGDDGGVPGRDVRVDLGHRVGHGEHHAVGRHRLDVGLGEDVRRRDAEEHVGAAHRVGQRAGDVVGVRVLGDPGVVRVLPRQHVGAPAVHDPVDVGDDDVLRAGVRGTA